MSNHKLRKGTLRLVENMRVLLTSAGLETEEIKECFMNMAGKDISMVKTLFIPTAAVNAGAIEVLLQYDVVYLCGGDTHYLLERINDTNFNMSLMEYINNNGLVIGVSAGSLIFSNNLCGNPSLIDTKLDVHCATGEKGGKLAYPSKDNVKLTNTCALIIRDIPDGMEIIGC